MRKLKLFIFLMLILFIAAGCGTSQGDSNDSKPNETPTEEKQQAKPLDLTGLWIQENASPEGFMVADVREDKIGVFLNDAEDELWTYWVGTYIAPESSDDSFEWTSISTYGGNGLFASSADSKEFKYKSGKLSFEMTAYGETGTIKLIRGDWDTSRIPDSAFGSVKLSTADLKPLEIANSDWTLDGDRLIYWIDIYNPNQTIGIEFPSYKVVARDENGVIITTDEQTLNLIYPNGHIVYGTSAGTVDATPATVEFEMDDPKEYNLKDISILGAEKPLEVINTATRTEKLVGEVRNPSDKDCEMVVVVVIIKDANGKLVDTYTEYVDDVGAGSDTAFSINTYGIAIDDSMTVEYYAYPWL